MPNWKKLNQGKATFYNMEEAEIRLEKVIQKYENNIQR
jgi:hypothetical protein